MGVNSCQENMWNLYVSVMEASAGQREMGGAAVCAVLSSKQLVV